ncbi:Hypothetical protein D9617_42g090290 [Elsinoe fawcettii]|nr:Hypothetical protein D9617_42g090290 [Elsinoe fawcettii]
MAFLPSSPIELEGGCMCRAVRYQITIPALEERPISRKAITYHHKKPVDGPTRLPFITIDHCEECRLSCGSLVQSWMIIPQPWIKFQLAQSDGSSSELRDYRCSDVVIPSAEVLKNTFIREYMFSEDSHRTFCGRCGSTLAYAYDENEKSPYGSIMNITVGTLDRDSLGSEGFRVDRQGWWDDGIPWIKNLLRNGDDGIAVAGREVTDDLVEGV